MLNCAIAQLFHCFMVSLLLPLPLLAAVGENTVYQIDPEQQGRALKPLVLGSYTQDGYTLSYDAAGAEANPFTFSLSSLITDFGFLSPQTPVTKSLDLIVYGGGRAYQVLAYANHPLKSADGKTLINDTLGDEAKIDEMKAATWSEKSVYGFGFNLAGDDIPSDFTGEQAYRQLADAEKKEKPQIIMSHDQPGLKTSKATVTYKVNLPEEKTARLGNTVFYLALPQY